MTGVAIGTAIVSYIEPHPGHEVDFNRWYERDHFPATVKAGPGVFAGARFVATRECKAIRPAAGRLFGDPARGSYLAVAWVLPGKQAEWDAWVAREMETIAAEGRLFPHRDHVHTAVYRCVWQRGQQELTSFEMGFPGAIVVADERELRTWSEPLEHHLAVGLRLERTVLSSADPPPHDLVIAFCAEPLTRFAALADELAGHGFASPFLATMPGTDAYTDEL